LPLVLTSAAAGFQLYSSRYINEDEDGNVWTGGHVAEVARMMMLSKPGNMIRSVAKGLGMFPLLLLAACLLAAVARAPGATWADLPIHLHIANAFVHGRNRVVYFNGMHSPVFAGGF
jgi:hypothetical protein